jgi:5-methylcytosine-specific restriction enzyme A
MPSKPPSVSMRPRVARKAWQRPADHVDKRVRGRAGVAIRERRLSRSDGLCEMCLAENVVRVATVVNHKLALADGGEDVDDNTENLCAEHDRIVTAEQVKARSERRRPRFR